MKKYQFLTATLLATTFFSAQAMAADGTCGTGCEWTLSNGNLHISVAEGYDTAAMDDHYDSSPWQSSVSSITSVTIDDGITKIGVSSFSGASQLTSLTIPDSVASIGIDAFENSGITSLTLPNNPNFTSLNYGPLDNMRYLTSLTIPDSVTSIGGDAIPHTLTSVTIPGSLDLDRFPNSIESVTVTGDTISSRFASGLTNLSSITFLDSVTSVGSGAFSGTQLTQDDLAGLDPKMLVENGALEGMQNLTSFTIPDNVTSIPDYAFYNTGLTSITIPDSVTSVGYGAFEGATSLTSVSIPDSFFDENGNLKNTISSQAFFGSNISTIYCPQGRDCSSIGVSCNENSYYSDKYGYCRDNDTGDETAPTFLGTIKTYTKQNGKYVASDGTVIGTYSEPEREVKRIYTTQEAIARTKELGGDTFTFKLRYK